MSWVRLGGRVCIVSMISALLLASPAAGWSGGMIKPTLPVQMASIGHEFKPVRTGNLLGPAAGVGGTSYVSSWGGVGGSTYFDVASMASVPVTLNGAINVERGPGVTLFPQVTVYRCSVAWNGVLGTCPGTQTLLRDRFSAASSAVSWGRVEVGESAYVAVFTGVGVGTVRMSATATASPVRSGMDRSNG